MTIIGLYPDAIHQEKMNAVKALLGTKASPNHET